MRFEVKFLLTEYGGKAITRKELSEIALTLGITDFDEWREYLLKRGYLIKGISGIYYVKTPGERLIGTASTFKIVSTVMEKLTENWYFGLYTALRLNGLTQEYYSTIYVINSKLTRSRPVKINGTPVMFVRMKEPLFKLGIERVGGLELKTSDPEKTLLDFLYLSRYGTVSRETAERVFRTYLPQTDRRKLLSYVQVYPLSLRKEVEQ